MQLFSGDKYLDKLKVGSTIARICFNRCFEAKALRFRISFQHFRLFPSQFSIPRNQKIFICIKVLFICIASFVIQNKYLYLGITQNYYLTMQKLWYYCRGVINGKADKAAALNIFQWGPGWGKICQTISFASYKIFAITPLLLGSAQNLHSSARLEPENSSSNSSLVST